MDTAEQFSAYEADHLIALQFESLEIFRKACDIYLTGRPAGYFAAPGRHSLIIPKQEVEWLIAELGEPDERVIRIEVKSIADLPPEEAARLRAQRGRSGNPEFASVSGKRAYLQSLKKRYSNTT